MKYIHWNQFRIGLTLFWAAGKLVVGTVSDLGNLKKTIQDTLFKIMRRIDQSPVEFLNVHTSLNYIQGL